MTASPPRVLPPLPAPSADDAPHWEGLRRGEFLIQQCGQCETLQHPPRPACARCHSLELGWKKASGRGMIYSYTFANPPVHPAWKDRTPFNIVLVQLEEDVRIVTNVVGATNEEIAIGRSCELVYEKITDEVTLARAKLV